MSIHLLLDLLSGLDTKYFAQGLTNKKFIKCFKLLALSVCVEFDHLQS